MQAAADDLVDRMASLARAMGASSLRAGTDVRDAERQVLGHLWHIGTRVSRDEHRRELHLGA